MTATVSAAGSAPSRPRDRRDIRPRRPPSSRCTGGDARQRPLKGCWRRVDPRRPDARPDRLAGGSFHESDAARLNPGALPSSPMARSVVRSRAVVMLLTALLVPPIAGGAALLPPAPVALAA